MSKNDGYEKWRQKEAVDLSNTMQMKIQIMQNPAYCGSAKKLYCTDNGGGCGIGNFFKITKFS
jgi:hypothetical protein